MKHDSTESRFEEQGSLEKPRAIGRLVRFMIGAFLLFAAYPLIPFSWLIENGLPLHPINILYMAIMFWVLPYVVNIGWSLNTRRLPQLTVIGLTILFGALDYTNQGVIYGPSLKIFSLVWVFYTAIHLGVSLFLAGILATPGCEMRSIPHLWTLLTGLQTREHYCPGIFDRLDRWERGRDKGSKMQK